MQKPCVTKLENDEIRTELQPIINERLSELRDNTEQTFKKLCVNVQGHITNTATMKKKN